jgi:hypothetical protein
MAPARAPRRGRTPVKAAALTLVVSAALALGVTPAQAAGPPQIQASWATNVAATSASLHAEANPEGLATALRFEFLTQSAYEANLAAAKEGFAGATRSPATGGVALGSGEAPAQGSRLLTQLAPNTAYRYRAVATNSAAPQGVIGPERIFTTEQIGAVFSLPDSRGWEMVSPVDKNGGQIQGPGQIFGGGLAQAAAQGGQLSYSSASSFGEGAQGAPAASQYLGARGPSAWSTDNVTAPGRSEAEPTPGAGVPYRLFSGDLSRALLYSGGHCSALGVGCANPSPPLAGSGAIPGYEDYYLRDNSSGTFQALITPANAPSLTLSPEAFEVRFAGATPDLSEVVLSTCAKLTPQASEECGGGGGSNLYRWSDGQLELINAGLSGAQLAAPADAISADGNRVYFTATEDGTLYLREGEATKLVSQGGAFQAASTDGGVAFFTKAGHLYRYSASAEEATDLTPSGGVQGVLGASTDGAYLYFADGGGLELWHEGTTTNLAAGAEAIDWPPATGAARVSADGTELLFSSTEPLTGFDNTDAATGKADAELFLYGASSKALACLSCNPTGERPSGSASAPGAITNGVGQETTQIYKPRALSADGRRVFFNSADALALQDTDNQPDVYQWEAPGEGSCAQGTQVNAGCVSLLSSGRDPEPSTFIDASADGADAFFLTDASLVPSDPGSYDLYDARVSGGYPVPPSPIPCEADACQALPSEPEDPTPGTLVPGDPNPPLHYTKVKEGTKGKGHHKGKGHKHHHKGGRK